MKRDNFIMVPRGLSEDPRLQPYFDREHVNPNALLYAVIMMIDRLSLKSNSSIKVKSLIAGLNLYHLSGKLLQEVVEKSGFFETNGDSVSYNWERFSNPEYCPKVARKLPEDCPTAPARTSITPYGDIETKTETENTPPIKKEKEKKREEERIHDIVWGYQYSEGERCCIDLHELESRLVFLLQKMSDSETASIVGRNLHIPDYREKWRDIVMAFVRQLEATGNLGKMNSMGMIQKYFTYFSKSTNPRTSLYQPGLAIQEDLAEKREKQKEELLARYSFEYVNPDNGHRFVDGMPIPEDAPPRPDAYSQWDYDESRWVPKEELERNRALNRANLQIALQMRKRRKEDFTLPL